MNYVQVLLQFCTLAGIDESEAEKYFDICCASGTKVEKHIKPGENPNDRRLIYAAAALAYYQFSLIKASGGISDAQSVTVGDITVSRGSGSVSESCKHAKELYEDAMASAADLMENPGTFYFKGV